MAQRWTQGDQLQRERDLLRLLDVDVTTLTASDVRLGAELCRRITEPDGGTPLAAQRRVRALDGWLEFRRVKAV
jgi:hypothetical protein